MNNIKIGFIGAGNMASAIINGIIKNKLYCKKQIGIFDIDKSKYTHLMNNDVNHYDSIYELVTSCRYIFLSVKPQNYKEVLNDIKQFLDKEKVFISIAAGISIDYINTNLGAKYPIVRAMPNTPLLLGCGATALCRSKNINDDDFNIVNNIFNSCGETFILPEDKMNTIISVNSSSPAYIYLLAKAMLDYSVNNGIDYETSVAIICKTFYGCAKMIKNSGQSIDKLIDMVASPGGTTIEAIKSLNDSNFLRIIKKAMDECTKRANELAK